ncbi:tetratricopeptide repeat protein [Desulfolutivibrio sulfoxidireducens]|uniref:tetratricopeptide repeat protein n=1 Tax=Desulfolutivibrio sulfoxidireducens TaxID=2773299 RepID=UPI00159D044A|nr:tetratricopeptide repeat protein [Desulfolutivibrio sulfoxidireducens]QLA18788.1 tetratricopeptide repeat protein [Desulfolutivibrio sulfoxidireducens]
MTSLDDYIASSEALLRRRKKKEALDLLDNALKEYPEAADLWRLKGELLIHLYLNSEGIKYLSKAVEFGGNTAWFLGCLSLGYFNTKNKNEAKKIAENTLLVMPNSGNDYLGQGHALLILDKYEDALIAFQKAIELVPTNPRLWTNYGNTYYSLKRYQEALEAHEKSLQIDISYATAWNNKANALQEMKSYDESLHAYDKAIGIDETYSVAWHNKGNILRSLNRENDALQAYEKALQFDKNFTAAWNGKGNVLKDLGHFDEAFSAYDMAIKIDPAFAGAWYNKGNLYYELTMFDQALNAYTTAIELDKHFVFAWNGKGNALLKLSRRKDALDSYKQAVYLNEKYPAAWNGMGNVYLEDNNLGSALSAYGKAIELDQNFSFAWNGKGNVYFALKKYDEAIQSYDKALAINSYDTDTLFNKGLAYESKSDFENALSSYEKSIDVDKKNAKAQIGKQRVLDLARKHYGTTASNSSFQDLIKIGRIEYHYGNVENSIKYFSQIPSTASEYNEANYYIGLSYQLVGDFTSAISAYNAVLNNNPDPMLRIFVLLSQAKAYISLGEFPQASKILREKALQSSNDDQIIRQVDELRQTLDNAHKLESLLTRRSNSSQKSSSTEPIPLDQILAIIQQKKDSMGSILASMKKTTQDRMLFLSATPAANEKSVFLVLRKWNSYTPIIPAKELDERSLGGGYYLRHNNHGVVIDPGLNFIENFSNAGLRMADIDTIVITHSHNDHTADLESLLTMAYKFNENNQSHRDTPPKKINLYMNLGSFKKYSGYINLHENYFGICRCIYPGDHIHLEDKENFVMIVLPAYHDEVVSQNHAVGLSFEMKANSESPDTQNGTRRILLTSDTSLFPRIKNKKTDESESSKFVANTSKPEIWECYGEHSKANMVDLLIVHLGSIKESEFSELPVEERLYPNHLGIIGTVRIISCIKSKLALISEFGEEFSSSRRKVVEFIRDRLNEIITPSDQIPIVLPGDINFEYNIFEDKIFCLQENHEDIDDAGYLSEPSEFFCSSEDRNICYLAKSSNEYFEKSGEHKRIKDASTKHRKSRVKGFGWYLRNESQPVDKSMTSISQETKQ